MTIRLLQGDCRQTLPTLEFGSVQAVITSPPYYGLRDYGLPPLVWGGDAGHEHEWGVEGRRKYGNLNEDFNQRYFGPSRAPGGKQTEMRPRDVSQGQLCPCGAWLGSLGLEPTPGLFVEHLVEVFRHVKRVLRDDGVLWLNLGDSYASGTSARRKEGTGGVGRWHNDAGGYDARVPTPEGLKTKDLMMMPFRVAMALQADGWWLRSVIPWLKRNSMPESVTDRPATSVEYVFLLTKSARYFWDADAVRNPLVGGLGGGRQRAQARGEVREKRKVNGQPNGNGHNMYGLDNPAGRNRRNSDWFFESWQGLLTNEEDDPLALVVNPAPFSGSHFATFPPKLVEPMIKASTRPGDMVLDPFFGAGTVGLVADRLQRNAIGCELKPEYADMGTKRIVGESPLFTEIVA